MDIKQDFSEGVKRKWEDVGIVEGSSLATPNNNKVAKTISLPSLSFFVYSPLDGAILLLFTLSNSIYLSLFLSDCSKSRR